MEQHGEVCSRANLARSHQAAAKLYQKALEYEMQKECQSLKDEFKRRGPLDAAGDQPAALL